jgi:hypothetical protein
MTDEEDFFDPHELEEIALVLDQIMSDEVVGYEMIFWVNANDAQEIVDSYDRFKEGSIEDAIKCVLEFGRIIEQLRHVLLEEENDN